MQYRCPLQAAGAVKAKMVIAFQFSEKECKRVSITQ
jgi:hypothetical protein